MRFAVVFKTYAWDEFVHRQARRCEAASAGGDFFIAADETNGTVGAIPFPNVVRTTGATLVAAGFANRFEAGSLLWWNPDYVHYAFAEQHPDYDYYVFVEYDVVIQGRIADMVHDAADNRADLVALPMPNVQGNWFWTLYHRQTYRLAEIHGVLACVSIFSKRALTVLAARRREMAAPGATAYWPSSEVFMPTEIARAGLVLRSIAAFGDVSRYAAFPPVLEDDLPPWAGPTLLHPVLDQPRMIASLLRAPNGVGQFAFRGSVLRRSLARFPPDTYRRGLAPAVGRRLRLQAREFLQRTRLRLVPGLLRD